MKYDITWCEVKQTQTGKTKMDASLQSSDGQVFDKVTIWGDFAGFTEIRPGSSVEGDIVTNGNWKTLSAPKHAPTGNAARGAGIALSQLRKADGISKSFDRKESGIEISATFRDATLITNLQLQGKNPDVDMVKDTWTYWRSWLLENWDVPKTDLKQPF